MNKGNNNKLGSAQTSHLYNAGFAKAILLICVMLCHSFAFWGGWFNNSLTPAMSAPYLGVFANWLGTFEVEGFVLVSGFIYSYIRHEKNGYADFTIFIKKKYQRLLIPYILVSLFWVIPIGNYFSHYTVKDVIWKYLLGVSPSQLWFLPMLFLVFMIFHILMSIEKNNKAFFFLLILALYGIGIIGISFLSNYNFYQIFTSLKYLLFFYIGYLFRRHYDRLFKSRFGLNSIAILSILLVVDVWGYALYVQYPKRSLFLALNVLGAIMSCSVLFKVSKWVENSPFSKYVSVVIDNSYGMYLLHQQIIYFVIYTLNGLVHPLLNASLNFIISFILSLLLTILLRKNKLTSYFVGASK